MRNDGIVKCLAMLPSAESGLNFSNLFGEGIAESKLKITSSLLKRSSGFTEKI